MNKQNPLTRLALAAALAMAAQGAWAQSEIKIGYNSDMSASGSADFGVSALSRLVVKECHAHDGTIASTRQSTAAVTSWMPPPYDAPTIPDRGSPFESSAT